MAPVGRERLSDLRDRALLLIGFAGAFRRSELVALDISDLKETTEGLQIMIRRSKTDQENHGAVIAIPRGSILFSRLSRCIIFSPYQGQHCIVRDNNG